MELISLGHILKVFFLQLINGIQLGSIYALMALGYTMVYGIAQLINFAHGDIIMVGAYVALFSIPLVKSFGLPVWTVMFISIIVCIVLGMLIERLAYRPLRNSPRIANLITAIGISIFLQNVALKFCGADSKTFPNILSNKSIVFQDAIISYNIIFTIGITAILTICLTIFLKKSKYGKAMIATSEDYSASSLVGIDINKMIQLTFAIGSGLAAVAAIFYVTAYPQVNAYIGAMPGIKSFIAAVIGGIGNIPGAVIGGLILGIIETLAKGYISSQLSDAFVFGILVVVLLVKPTGIFGKNIKEKV